MKKLLTMRVILIVCLFGFVGCTVGLTEEATGATALEVATAWEARSKSTETLHVKWSSTLSHFLTPEKEYSETGELALDARGSGREKFRFAVTNLNMDGYVPPRLKVQPSVYVFDGARSVIHFDEEPDYGRAMIGNAGEGIGPDLRIVALRMLYRPFDKNLGVFKREFPASSEGKTEFDGQNCLLFTLGRYSLWVTDDERLLPVRLIGKYSRPDDRRFHELRVQYTSNDNGAWLPQSWTLTQFGTDGQTIVESREVEVKRCVINEDLPNDLFVISEFPHGTWVTDSLRDIEYIVREGKADRVVLPGEFTGHNYAQLLNSEAPDVRGKTGSFAWLWLGNALLIALMAGVWYWKRRASPTNDLDIKGTA